MFKYAPIVYNSNGKLTEHKKTKKDFCYMKKLKHYLAMICGAMLLLFVLQNMTIVEINFLFWSFQTSRFVIIAFSLLTGILIGMIISSNKNTGSDPDIDPEE